MLAQAITFSWRVSIEDLRQEISRYSLSFAWWFIDPVAYCVIFWLLRSVVLSRLETNAVPFLLVGLLWWRLFSSIVMEVSQATNRHAQLARRLNVPLLSLSIAPLISNSLKFAISLIIIIPLWIYFYEVPIVNLLHMAILFITTLMMSWTLGAAIMLLAPVFPDVRLVMTHILRAIFMLSGIFYSIANIEIAYRSILALIPSTAIIDHIRHTLLGTTLSIEGIGPSIWVLFLASAAVMIIGMLAVRASQQRLLKLYL
ncbi:ABC transporter permease [Hyphobacterium sp. CCMP332]|uniref:ABC transporter permease n=1 Tax=Hyphobacterium sp. CCMP332 TaxID=2749086 RepID=UPI00164FF28D|nr:ABC transporter permease [Hyphobacterium sp. CCMP332]QNL17874.1 ABC transporter permease [Hyphobacterium sp. CCMP332]